MKKKNTSGNPSYQKILIRKTANTSETKDLLSFDFYDDTGITWNVGQLFDQILRDKDEIESLKKYVKELEAVENKSDILLANSIENLSRQILLIEKSINEKIDKINDKIKYL